MSMPLDGHVLAVTFDILLMFCQLGLKLLLQEETRGTGLGQSIDDVHDQMKPVQLVQDGHVECGCDGSFLLVTPDMDICVIGSSVGQLVDECGIGVKGEDDRLIARKKFIKIPVVQAVGMFRNGLQAHEIDHVDDADFQ